MDSNCVLLFVRRSYGMAYGRIRWSMKMLAIWVDVVIKDEKVQIIFGWRSLTTTKYLYPLAGLWSGLKTSMTLKSKCLDGESNETDYCVDSSVGCVRSYCISLLYNRCCSPYKTRTICVAERHIFSAAWRVLPSRGSVSELVWAGISVSVLLPLSLRRLSIIWWMTRESWRKNSCLRALPVTLFCNNTHPSLVRV